MDVLTVVFFSLLSAGTTGVLVTVNRRQSTTKLTRRREQIVYTNYLLPEPGQNLELYKRAKEVMDGLVADRFEAQFEAARTLQRLEESETALEDSQLEQERLREENERLLAENKRLTSKIETAQEMVRSFTHPGMKIVIDPKPRPERRRIVTIL